MKKNTSLYLFLFFSTFGYSQFRPYVPQNPVNAMRSVGMYKQRLYNERKDCIQGRINGLIKLSLLLVNEDDYPNIDIEYSRDVLKSKVTSYVKTIGYIDFADDYQFNLIQQRFSSIENYYYKYCSTLAQD
jgi:hypothetical protein